MESYTPITDVMSKILSRIVGCAVSLVVSAVVAVSCSSQGASGDVALAEEAIANNDPSRARSIADGLVKGRDLSRLSVSELGRLSMVYMQLSDMSDEGESVANATQCFREAFKLNADSARVFYSGVPVECEKYVFMLSAIVRTIDNPGELPADEPLAEDDSLGVYSVDSLMR